KRPRAGEALAGRAPGRDPLRPDRLHLAGPAGPHGTTMSLRYLYGPVDAPASARLKAELPDPAACVTFGPGADVEVHPFESWEQVLGRLPADFRPDLVALWLPYGSAPAWAWSAPVPVVALAPDWTLNWHAYRNLLPCCDAALTDLP